VDRTVGRPIDQPLPLDLIGEIVRFRVAENIAAAEAGAERCKTSQAKRREQDGA
jgi:hypothetical protein